MSKRAKTTINQTTRAAMMLTAAVASVTLTGMPSHAATIGWNVNANGEYTDANNWVDGDINGIWDPSLTFDATRTITMNQNVTASNGLSFGYTGGSSLTLTGTGGAKTLTLGGDITHSTSGNVTVNLGSSVGSANLNVDLGGETRTFNVVSGRSLGFVNAISNGGVVVNGGTVNYSGANTYSGDTTVQTGNLSLNGANGSVANSDVTVTTLNNNATTLTFNNSGNGIAGTTRAKSVTLNGRNSAGAALVYTSTANGTVNSIETITNALSTVGGYSTVTLSAHANRNARLQAGSYERSAGSTMFFRGTNLGVNSIASQTAGSTNIQFTAAPTLTGAGGAAGTSTVSILRGAYGDTVSNSSGNTATAGLVTYDATNGVRLLDKVSEYTASITDGQTQGDNVRFVRASGGASQDVTLTNPTTTINSLSFDITGGGTNSGVTIAGDADTTLKLNSGAIFASQRVTAVNSTDAMVISVPTLDLNGQEGTIVVFTNGVNNGNTSAPLRITSTIANDGGNGVTIGGTGQVIFSGATANTYTGVTTLNSGILRLDKSIDNAAITGDFVINGGNLLKGPNEIADTASVTINGGTFWMDSATSSGNNGHSETIHNFTINGGGFGNHGTGAILNVNGDATINGSQLGMNAGGDITVLGNTALNGGLLIAREANSDTVASAVTTLNTLSINNLAAGAYTPLTLNAHTTNLGARLILNGDVTFTGNGTNANTTTIDTSDAELTNQGLIELNGTRAFAVGNGAADVDLTVVPALVDGSTTGGLTKTGAGTLELGGASTFTGPTTVDAGRLLVNGSLASTVTVNGGTLGGNGSIAGATTVAGTLAPGASAGLLSFGSTLGLGGTSSFEVDGLDRGVLGGYDAVDVTGELSYGGILNVAFSSAFADGSEFNLFDFDSTTGNFTGISLTGSYATTLIDGGDGTWSGSAGGQEFTFSTSTGVLSIVSAVPEPTSIGMLIGATGLLLRRRRVR